MIVSGFLSFGNLVDVQYPQDPNFGIIQFNNGYFSYPLNLNSYTCPFKFAIFSRIEAKEIRISSLTDVNEDISVYDLNSQYFDKSNLDNLGLGVWYDETSRSLQLYREVFGQVPLFYVFIPNKFVAFSTSLTSLLKIPQLRQNLTPDLKTILQYSQLAADSRTYYSEDTFYNEVKAALPGNIITFDSNDSKTQLNPSFNTSKWDHLTSLEEYGEAFCSLFKRSINSSLMNEVRPISAHLSGGLDSSSISVASSHLFPDKTIHTLYALTETKSSDEAHFAKIVAKKIGSTHHEVVLSTNYIESLLNYTSLYGHPEKMVLAGTFQGSLMSHAKNIGAGTQLIGHPGDSIVGSGFSLIHQEVMNRNWPLTNELLKQRSINVVYHPEFEDWMTFSETKKNKIISRHYLFKELSSAFRKENLFRFLMLTKDLHFNTELPIGSILSELPSLLKRKIFSRKNNFSTLANEGLLRLPPRQQNRSYVENSFWTAGIQTTQTIGFNEEIYVLGNHYGIKNRFPFYSKELYELSLAVPEIIKFDKGRGRGHLREAMKGLLPEVVRNRTDKAKFGIYNNFSVLQFYSQSQDFLGPKNEVWNYLDKSKFNIAVKSLESNMNVANPNSLLILRAISLSVWLYLFKNNGFI